MLKDGFWIHSGPQIAPDYALAYIQQTACSIAEYYNADPTELSSGKLCLCLQW